METDDFYISTKHCTTDKSALLSIHEPLLHLDDDSILEGQLLCFNQKLDLLCSISVINWLIISGLLPLNYGADCKWTWWSSPLKVTYTKWDTSCRFLPCLVTAHTLLWLPKRCWRNLPLPGPFLPHFYYPLRETQEACNVRTIIHSYRFWFYSKAILTPIIENIPTNNN